MWKVARERIDVPRRNVGDEKVEEKNERYRRERDNTIAIFFFFRSRSSIRRCNILLHYANRSWRTPRCNFALSVCPRRGTMNEPEIITHDRVAVAKIPRQKCKPISRKCVSQKKKMPRLERFARVSFETTRDSARQNVLQRLFFAFRIDTRSKCALGKNFVSVCFGSNFL